jgi:hypothetical protein
VLEEVTTDNNAPEGEEGFVDVIASFVSGTKSAHLMEPTDSPLDHPAMNT